MTAFSTTGPGFPRRAASFRFAHWASFRFAHWTAFALTFAVLTLPDCCLNGRHRAGLGMDAFAFVCHAAP
jgi:hypothetical protein